MRSIEVSIGPGEGVDKAQSRAITVSWIAIALWTVTGSGAGRRGTDGADQVLRRAFHRSVPNLPVTLPTVSSAPSLAIAFESCGARDRARQRDEQIATCTLVRTWPYFARGARSLEPGQLFEQHVARELQVQVVQLASSLAPPAGDDQAHPNPAGRHARRHA